LKTHLSAYFQFVAHAQRGFQLHGADESDVAVGTFHARLVFPGGDLGHTPCGRGSRGSRGGGILRHAQMLPAMDGKLGALEIFRPVEIVGFHQLLTHSGRFAKRSAGRYGYLQNCADRNIERAEEQLEIIATADLHERSKLMDLQTRFFLLRMANKIRHNGHVIGYILADRNGDGFAAIVVG